MLQCSDTTGLEAGIQPWKLAGFSQEVLIASLCLTRQI